MDDNKLKISAKRQVPAAVDVVNNWQYLTYVWNGRELDETDKVKVVWPDQTESWCYLRMRKQSAWYSDHGIQHEVEQERLYAIVPHHGQKLTTPLEGLMIVDVEGAE